MPQVPSYHGFRPASEAASRAKRGNKRRDTVHEVLLRRAVWHLGLRFRKNVESLLGKPELLFAGARVVVFCDGDFWHGRNWLMLKEKLQQRANASYWIAKIQSNIDRDERHTIWWREAGWKVIRLWETDIKKDPLRAAYIVKEAVETGRAFWTKQSQKEAQKRSNP